MASEVVIGVDPDTKNLAWAVATRHEILAVGVIKSPSGQTCDMARYASAVLPGVVDRWKVDMCVVEGQEFHHGGKAPPADILKLANVAGTIVGILAIASAMRLCVAKPSEWKGQTPKPINHERTFQHYGILCVREQGYCYPAGCAKAMKIAGIGQLVKSDWKHVSDAVGLALFGGELLRSVT